MLSLAARPPLARRVPARTVGALCVLGAGVLGVATGWGGAPWWAVLLLTVSVALSEVAVVHLHVGRQRWTLSLTEAALGAALVLWAGAWTVPSVAIGVAVAQRLWHQPRLERAYDLARVLAATSVGAAVAVVSGGQVLGACLGMGACWLVNDVLVAVGAWLTAQRPFRSRVISSATLSALHTAGNTSLGLLAAYLSLHAPLGLLGLVVLLALLWSSYDQQTRRSAEARLFAELAGGQERETGRSSDVSAQVVVTAARLLGGADVELVLLAADGPVRYTGAETGVPDRRRVGSDVFDEAWVLRALGERGVSAGRSDSRPCLSAVIGDTDSALAVLRARRGADAAAFDRHELRLVEVLVGQAATWLSVADLSARSRAASERAAIAGDAARALSDLGSATAPALLVLRESADRLARLAEIAGGVDDIVEELHLVEQAVASLLGAIALAAEPELLRPSVPESTAHLCTEPTSRPGADWTTTGVLW